METAQEKVTARRLGFDVENICDAGNCMYNGVVQQSSALKSCVMEFYGEAVLP